MKLHNDTIVFTGGGTAGHIYPGLAVADELKTLAMADNNQLKIYWIGCSKGMDKNIVEKALGTNGEPTADKFFGIPSGKLRRYFSMQNFTDLFRIIGGYFSAKHILRKLKPAVLFSKGGFVSVPPCLAAKHLGIPVYTHECDFTLGLANRLNFKSATNMFVSYKETKDKLSKADQERVIVTGNPVRPVFYNTNTQKGMEFIWSNGEIKSAEKPILLVLGGSSGAKQINQLVQNNLEFLCKHYNVVHQTGLINNDSNCEQTLKEKYGDSYRPFNFIYKEMPDVLSAADVILSRAGANSIWEAAVLYKPMVLIPLCGNGTRGDQVDNAKFFKEKGAAQVLIGEEATDDNLQKALTIMLNADERKKYSDALKVLVGEEKPAKKIAQIIYEKVRCREHK